MNKDNKIEWGNPKERKKYQKEYDGKNYEANKEKIRQRNKGYYQNNSEKVKQTNKNYRKNNKEKVRLVRSKNQKDYIKKYPEKIKAHSIANNKINIPMAQLCEICNKHKAKHRHHEDYTKPLEVIFVCIKCHNNLHNGDEK